MSTRRGSRGHRADLLVTGGADGQSSRSRSGSIIFMLRLNIPALLPSQRLTAFAIQRRLLVWGWGSPQAGLCLEDSWLPWPKLSGLRSSLQCLPPFLPSSPLLLQVSCFHPDRKVLPPFCDLFVLAFMGVSSNTALEPEGELNTCLPIQVSVPGRI